MVNKDLIILSPDPQNGVGQRCWGVAGDGWRVASWWPFSKQGQAL
jgi:hypothetical protein